MTSAACDGTLISSCLVVCRRRVAAGGDGGAVVAYPVLGLAALEGLLDGLHSGRWMSIGTVEVASLHSEGVQRRKMQKVENKCSTPFVKAALKEVQIQTRRGEGQGLSQR